MHRPGERKLLAGKFFYIQRKPITGEISEFLAHKCNARELCDPPKAHSKSVAELGNGTASPASVQCAHHQCILPPH